MEFDIKAWLKALLFSTSDPLEIKQIQWVYNRVREEQIEGRQGDENEEIKQEPSEEVSESDEAPVFTGFPVLLTSTSIREAMNELEREFDQRKEVYRLLLTKDGYRLCIAPEYADWVRALRGETKPLKLSQAALETLAIVAYRQPVTRAEMERIRGVAIDSALGRLIELDLVISRGRAELPGRPLQYGTTDKFMDFCGLESLSDLPTSDIVSSEKLDEWVNRPLGDSDDTQESLDLKV
jgi:segregation and condensation protein B